MNPNGAATTWHVEYGTSTSYGTNTASTSAGSGTTSVAIAPTLSGLTAGTIYHYRVVATNSSGTGRGADGILTTSSTPQVVTGSASSVSAGVCDAQRHGQSEQPRHELVLRIRNEHELRHEDRGEGRRLRDEPGHVSAPVTGLTSGRTYHFRLVATSDAGTSRGADQSFLASAPPTVTTKAASSVKDSTATLNASVNPNGVATTVYFDYGTTTSYGTKSSTKSIGSGRSAANVAIPVTGLAPGVLYHVRVVASNSVGTNAGGDVTFTTTGAPVVRTSSATGSASTLQR